MYIKVFVLHRMPGNCHYESLGYQICIRYCSTVFKKFKYIQYNVLGNQVVKNPSLRICRNASILSSRANNLNAKLLIAGGAVCLGFVSYCVQYLVSTLYSICLFRAFELLNFVIPVSIYYIFILLGAKVYLAILSLLQLPQNADQMQTSVQSLLCLRGYSSRSLHSQISDAIANTLLMNFKFHIFGIPKFFGVFLENMVVYFSQPTPNLYCIGLCFKIRST